ANFVLQNGRGYVPLAAATNLLAKLLSTQAEFHAAGRRLFVGAGVERFTLELRTGNPSRLLIGFPSAVNPTIATEPGRVRFTFRREPVAAAGPDNVTYTDPLITGASFSEHDGIGARHYRKCAADGQLCRQRQNHHCDCCSRSASTGGRATAARGGDAIRSECTGFGPTAATAADSALFRAHRSRSRRQRHRRGRLSFVA